MLLQYCKSISSNLSLTPDDNTATATGLLVPQKVLLKYVTPTRTRWVTIGDQFLVKNLAKLHNVLFV